MRFYKILSNKTILLHVNCDMWQYFGKFVRISIEKVKYSYSDYGEEVKKGREVILIEDYFLEYLTRVISKSNHSHDHFFKKFNNLIK